VFAAHVSKRNAKKHQATPRWAELDQIEELYAEAARLSQETGESYHVDHIVPLQSDVVCGLHCLDNLQILTAEDNLSKNNKFEEEQ